jgi:hypothetical protein
MKGSILAPKCLASGILMATPTQVVEGHRLLVAVPAPRTQGLTKIAPDLSPQLDPTM